MWVGATLACLHEAFRRRQVAQKAPLHGTLPNPDVKAAEAFEIYVFFYPSWILD